MSTGPDPVRIPFCARNALPALYARANAGLVPVSDLWMGDLPVGDLPVGDLPPRC